jgi:hypothetical protein
MKLHASTYRMSHWDEIEETSRFTIEPEEAAEKHRASLGRGEIMVVVGVIGPESIGPFRNAYGVVRNGIALEPHSITGVNGPLWAYRVGHERDHPVFTFLPRENPDITASYPVDLLKDGYIDLHIGTGDADPNVRGPYALAIYHDGEEAVMATVGQYPDTSLPQMMARTGLVEMIMTDHYYQGGDGPRVAPEILPYNDDTFDIATARTRGVCVATFKTVRSLMA